MIFNLIFLYQIQLNWINRWMAAKSFFFIWRYRNGMFLYWAIVFPLLKSFYLPDGFPACLLSFAFFYKDQKSKILVGAPSFKSVKLVFLWLTLNKFREPERIKPWTFGSLPFDMLWISRPSKVTKIQAFFTFESGTH